MNLPEFYSPFPEKTYRPMVETRTPESVEAHREAVRLWLTEGMEPLLPNEDSEMFEVGWAMGDAKDRYYALLALYAWRCRLYDDAFECARIAVHENQAWWGWFREFRDMLRRQAGRLKDDPFWPLPRDEGTSPHALG